MGRKSKLTPEQWAAVDRRLLDGESCISIARSCKVSEATIRARKIASAEKIKDVANQIVATENALNRLPIAAQIAAKTFASKLRALSDHMLNAATYSAATSHRLHGIAAAKVQEVDDADPTSEKSVEALRIVSALTKVANEAHQLPVAIFNGSKDRMSKIDDVPPEPSIDVSRLSDGTLQELMDARAPR